MVPRTRASTTSSSSTSASRRRRRTSSDWESSSAARRRGHRDRCGSRSSASTSQLEDAYLSVVEALRHSGFLHGCAGRDRLGRLRDARRRRGAPSALRAAPTASSSPAASAGAASRARSAPRRSRASSGIPYLGICLGHADRGRRVRPPRRRHGRARTRPSSTPRRRIPVIDLLPEQKEVADLGGTMRLGADPIKLHAGTRARELYGEAVIYERHRHRYEVNNLLRKRLEAAGLVVSGTSPDERLVEVIELADHPFFVASQFHPEFKSRPERPAPLFREFVRRGAGARRASGARGSSRDAASAARRAASAAGLRGRAPAPERAVRRAVPRSRARSGTSGVRRPRGRASCASMGLEVGGRDETRQPARRAIAGARRSAAVLLCAHLDTVAADGADRAGARRRRLGERQRRRSSAPTTRPRSRCMLEVARARRVEGAPVGLELLFTVARGDRARGRQGVRRRARCAVALRLRLRPRDADRRDRRRLADLLPPRGRVPRRGRPRRHPPRGRAQRDRRRGARRSRRCASAASTTRRPRTSAGSSGGVGLDERRRPSAAGSLAEARSLDAERGRGGRRRDGRPRPRRRQRRPSATSTSPSSACSSGYRQRAVRAGRRGRRGGAARVRLRARAASPPAAARTPTRSRPPASRA